MTLLRNIRISWFAYRPFLAGCVAFAAIAVLLELATLYLRRFDSNVSVQRECTIAGEIAAVVARTRDLGEPVITEPEVTFSARLVGSPFDDGYPIHSMYWTQIAVRNLYGIPKPIDCGVEIARHRLVISEESMRDNLRLGPEKYSFSRISMSRDGNNATVRVTMSCGGTCGFGWRTLWKRTDGSWTLISKDMLWIS
jgi:hypothetical protein